MTIDLRKFNPNKILITSDWHGKTHLIEDNIHLAKQNGIEIIIHLGDLGYNYYESDSDFEENLDEMLVENDVFMLWIDGNKENHEWLNTLDKRADGFVQTGPSQRLFYIPRGTTWEWNNIVFGGLGGAHSVNQNQLIEGVTLFSDLEEPDSHDVEKLFSKNIDILFSHDVPYGIHIVSNAASSYTDYLNGLETPKKVRSVIDNNNVKKVYCGHRHQEINTTIKNTEIVGIDGENNSLVLDLSTL